MVDISKVIAAIGSGGRYPTYSSHQVSDLPPIKTQTASRPTVAEYILGSSMFDPRVGDYNPGGVSASGQANYKSKQGAVGWIFDKLQRPLSSAYSMWKYSKGDSALLNPATAPAAILSRITSGQGTKDLGTNLSKGASYAKKGASGEIHEYPSKDIAKMDLSGLVGNKVYQGIISALKTTPAGGILNTPITNASSEKGLKFTAGLAADTAFDPLSFIPGAAISGPLKAVSRTARGKTVAEVIPKGTKLPLGELKLPKGGVAPPARGLYGNLSRGAVQASSSSPRVGSVRVSPGVAAQLAPLTDARVAGEATRGLSSAQVARLRQAVNPSPIAVPNALDLISRISRGSVDEAVQTMASIAPKLGAPIELTPELKGAAVQAAEKLRKTLRKGGFNPALQTQLLRKVQQTASSGEEARSMLKVAEDHLAALGKPPQDWDGTSLRLSEVVDELHASASGVDIAGPVIGALGRRGGAVEPAVADAVSRVKARGAMNEAGHVSATLDQAVRESASVAGMSREMQRIHGIKFSRDARGLIRRLGGSQAAQRATTQLIGDIARSTTPLDRAYVRAASQLRNTAKGKSFNIAQVRNTIDRGLAESGVPVFKAKPGVVLAAEYVVGPILARVKAAYGESLIHDAVQVAKHSARTQASIRKHELSQILNTLSKEDRDLMVRAMNDAEDLLPSELPQVVRMALTETERIMGDLFRTSGLARIHNEALSAADRVGMVYDDLNRMLKNYGAPNFQFTPKKIEQAIAKYGDWQMAWKSMPYTAEGLPRQLFALQTAGEQLVHEYAMIDDIASKFGITYAKQGFREVRHARLKGTYFQNEVASQVEHALNTMHQIYNPKSKFMRFAREATNSMKLLMTIINPQHHSLNFMGDAYLSFLAGMTDPKWYALSAQVMKRHYAKFMDPMLTARLLAEGAELRAYAGVVPDVVTKWRGQALSSERVFLEARRRGVFLDMHAVEDIVGDTHFADKLARAPIINKASKVSEVNSNHARLAHFMWSVSKDSKSKTLKEALDKAAAESFKWHPDSMDLTKFEQVTRLLIPFYSWQRKAIPLVIHGAVVRPGKFLYPNKAMYNWQQSVMGEDPETMADPFNTGGEWPYWFTRPGTNSPVFAPRLPGTDVLSMLSNPRQTAANMLHPAVRAPIELTMEKRLSNGSYIGDKSNYLLKQTPVLGKYQGMATSDDPKNSVFNWATGLNRMKPDDPNSPFADYKADANLRKKDQMIRDWANKSGIKNRKGEPYFQGSGVPAHIRSDYEDAHGGIDTLNVSPKEYTKYNKDIKEWAKKQGYKNRYGAPMYRPGSDTPPWIKKLYEESGGK